MLKKSGIWIWVWLILLVGIAPAENLTGKWVAEMQTPNGEKMQIAFTFQQDGEKLSGTVGGPMGEMPIIDGTVKDKEFSFAVKFEQEGNEMKMQHKGTIDGDSITITLVPPEGAPADGPKMEMKAKRAGEKTELSGQWTAEWERQNGEKVKTVFALKQDGEKLSGTVTSPRGEREISDGKVSGKEFSFVVKIDMNGEERKIDYKGVVDGDALKITMTFPERPGRELIAKKEAAGLTGRWAAETQRQNGDKMKTVFLFKQEGETLSGTVTSPRGEREISEGKVNGKEFSFVTKVTFNGEERRFEYKGTIDGESLKISTVMQAGRPAREYVAKRESAEEAAKAEAQAKAQIPQNPLPAVKDMPDNGLVRTPPMGWNSWNKFAGRINDKAVREIADAMVESGMKQAGYQYIVIDDTWEGKRGSGWKTGN